MDNTSPFQPWAANDNVKNAERELTDDAKLHRENVNHPKHTQTASYDKETIVTGSNAPGPSNPEGVDSSGSKESKMDSGKIASMQQIVENTLSQEGRQRVTQLLEAVEALSSAERLLLYLRLPTGVPSHDPLKQPINPLGSRAELQQTVTWIQTHLEVDPDVSLPKQDVYDEYIAHCMSCNMKPLSTADFGKVMKQVYPTVRPRRLGTRGNSRYCYAGLRKKIKLEVPQLPDLGESSKEPSVPREAEMIICDWAETKLGVKFTSISELSRHVVSLSATQHIPPRPLSGTPPPLLPAHGPVEDVTSKQLMKQLKRKIQTQGVTGRPKKNKGQEVARESPPSTFVSHQPVKHETELIQDPGYGYPHVPIYDVRPPFTYTGPPRAHPMHSAHHPPPPVPEYRPDPYVFESPYTRHDIPLPTDTTYNLPINLSSDASLDLSTERVEWPRRRPPQSPPTRVPLPGKKLILETYQSETQAGSPRPSQQDPRTSQKTTGEFQRTEYLPKKMRAAEILGGKLASARQALAAADVPSTSSTVVTEPSIRPEAAFLEGPKNVTSRSKSTAAAPAREEQEAASPTQSVKAPTPKSERLRRLAGLRKLAYTRSKEPSPDRVGSPKITETPDSCCGLDGINIKTGMICEEKHSEILNRERVISICNIDKHDLDDYLNEGNSQEHEEELLQYFHQRASVTEVDPNPSEETVAFLEAGLDPQDEHSQGKNEKLSQLRELLAKNLKNPSGSSSQNISANVEQPLNQETPQEQQPTKSGVNEGAFKPVPVTNVTDMPNGPTVVNRTGFDENKLCSSIPNENTVSLPFVNNNSRDHLMLTSAGQNLYNGNCHNVPQSPTTRTQQYDFVPISDACHSPGNLNSKSPLGFGHRGHSPSKVNKQIIVGGSLQTSPISYSTAASPFVSPRNTPVPRSRVLCSRPIPKHSHRKKRNPPMQPISLGVDIQCPNQFAIPNDQKFLKMQNVMCAPGIRYCQPMSAPPSPNILSPQYKSQMFHCNSVIPNGNHNLRLNFLPNVQFREHMNGELVQPLSADPLSNEVSQFFQEPIVSYRTEDASYRSQSVPLKQGLNNIGLLSYNNTPAGSVPPTPVPNEFCDFGSLADACDISKAGLNPETLDKIYDAIDSSNEVLSTGATQSILSTNNALSNGCDQLSQPQILTDDLNSLIPGDSEIMERNSQFNHSFTDDSAAPENVEDFLKRTNSIEFDLSELVNDKSKYYTSRSVPSTPLPYKRAAPDLQIDSRRSRELFTAENYTDLSNSISSKSVPSTPQLAEERSVFNYSNRDFLINGNSLEVCGSSHMHGPLVDSSQGLSSPLHDMLREDITEPLTPAADLLADLDKMDATSYGDL